MGYTFDAGGDALVSAGTLAVHCDFTGFGSGVGVGTEYFGPYTSQQTVDISLSIGTYLPHYAFDVYLSLILQDVNSGGSTDWKGNTKMWAALLASGTTVAQNKSQSIQTSDGSSNQQSTNSGKVIAATNGACGDTGKRDNYMRVIYTDFQHNSTGTPLTVQLTTDNPSTNAAWYFR